MDAVRHLPPSSFGISHFTSPGQVFCTMTYGEKDAVIHMDDAKGSWIVISVVGNTDINSLNVVAQKIRAVDRLPCDYTVDVCAHTLQRRRQLEASLKQLGFKVKSTPPKLLELPSRVVWGMSMCHQAANEGCHDDDNATMVRRFLEKDVSLQCAYDGFAESELGNAEKEAVDVSNPVVQACFRQFDNPTSPAAAAALATALGASQPESNIKVSLTTPYFTLPINSPGPGLGSNMPESAAAAGAGAGDGPAPASPVHSATETPAAPASVASADVPASVNSLVGDLNDLGGQGCIVS